jgi:hypothetical protein
MSALKLIVTGPASLIWHIECVQLAAAGGPASLLAGVNGVSLITSAPIHAAASCEHHSGSKLPAVHGRYQGVLGGWPGKHIQRDRHFAILVPATTGLPIITFGLESIICMNRKHPPSLEWQPSDWRQLANSVVIDP